MMEPVLTCLGTGHCMVRNRTLHVGTNDDMTRNGTLHAKERIVTCKEQNLAH